MMSDTLVKVALLAVVGTTMVVVWRRWHDGTFLALAVIVESTVFAVVQPDRRPRPPAGEQLDSIPPSGSFPSGHTAAAVAFYGGLYVVVRWHTRRRGVRALFLAIGIVVPLIVATSRVARGMHHLIDVIAGLALGVATLLVLQRRCGRASPSSSGVPAGAAVPRTHAQPRDAGHGRTTRRRQGRSTRTPRRGDEHPDDDPEPVARRRGPGPPPPRTGLGGPAGLVRQGDRLPAPRHARRSHRAGAACSGRDGAGAEGEASQTGAVARIAESSAGTLALWIVAIGLVLYVLWRVASVLLPTDGSAKAWVDPSRLRRQRDHVLTARRHGDLARSPRRRDRRGETEESKVDRITREPDGHRSGALVRRPGRGGDHRRRPRLRRSRPDGQLPRGARARWGRSARARSRS